MAPRRKRTSNPHGRAQGLPDEFLMCRLNRHAYQLLGLYRENGFVVMLKECRDCEKVDDVILDRSFGIVNRRPHYPAGYLMDDHDGRLDGAAVRAEVIRRFEVYDRREDVMQHAGGGSA